MEQAVGLLTMLLDIGKDYFSTTPEQDLVLRSAEGKWSKKEILGHLIDSAIHNLVRFTEINYSIQPYELRSYRQNELVRINSYQAVATNQLLELWISLNTQILHILKQQSKQGLNYEVILPDQSAVDLRFIMNDYVQHMAHHLKQITT